MKTEIDFITWKAYRSLCIRCMSLVYGLIFLLTVYSYLLQATDIRICEEIFGFPVVLFLLTVFIDSKIDTLYQLELVPCLHEQIFMKYT